MKNTLKNNLILVFIGLAAVAVSTLLTAAGKKQAARDTEPVSATFVEYVESQEYDSVTETFDTVYFPVLLYEANGIQVRSQYSQSDSTKKYEPGTAIDIRYNPEDPAEFIIVGDNRIQSGAIWVAPVGALIFLFGFGRILIPIIKSKKQ